MAISITPFERQLSDFGEACKAGRAPSCSGVEGYKALELVRSIYIACAEARKVQHYTGQLVLKCEAALLVDAAGQKAAVDSDHFTGDKRGCLRGQEDRCPRQFVGLAEAMHRRAQQQFLAARRALDKRRVQRRWKDARRNRIHVDTAPRQFDGQDFGERSHRGLAGGVGRDPGKTHK